MSRVFLRGDPTPAERRDAASRGIYPFTVSEFRSERKRLTSLKNRPATYAETIEECYRDYARGLT